VVVAAMAAMMTETSNCVCPCSVVGLEKKPAAKLSSYLVEKRYNLSV
jgi:hypothetical protein